MKQISNRAKETLRPAASASGGTASSSYIVTQTLNIKSSAKSVARYEIGSERIPTIKLYFDRQLTAVEAAKVIGITPSAFHKIIRKIRAHGGDLNAAAPDSPGRKPFPMELRGDVEKLIDDALTHYEGKAATIEKVWVAAQTIADERCIERPSYHAVRRRLLKKGPRALADMRLGRAVAKDIFEARPGYKVTSRPMEWVQIDHTRVDLIVVDEENRKVIDRPWVSFAICIHTRAIVGFYLSLLPPNAVTVAMLIENCVLPKTALLESLGLDNSIWPMYGIPEVIHADNAAEFRSEVLKSNLKRFGVLVEHRDVGKKHQGGHIERLIGTMMTSHIHFLRGTTYSDSKQRGDEDSQSRAAISIGELRKIFICNIHAYNNRKHSAIKMFPSRKWSESLEGNVKPREIEGAATESFRYALYPERQKLVRTGGIEMHGRSYYALCLQDKVRDRLTVKFNPADLSSIFVDIDGGGTYVRIPMCRNTNKRSNDYALYRVERQEKGERDGTYSAEATASLALGAEFVAQAYLKTDKRKRKLRKEAGERDHVEYIKSIDANVGAVRLGEEKEIIQKGGLLNTNARLTKTARGKDQAQKSHVQTFENQKKEPVQGWRGFAQRPVSDQIDFDTPPTIY